MRDVVENLGIALVTLVVLYILWAYPIMCFLLVWGTIIFITYVFIKHFVKKFRRK